MIIPTKEEVEFLKISEENGLHLQTKCNVRGTESSPIKRVMIELGFDKITPTITSLTIEIERHKYTPEYIELVKDFYLKM